MKFSRFFYLRENLLPFVNLEPFLEPVTITYPTRSKYNCCMQDLARMLYTDDKKLPNLTNTFLLKQKPEVRQKFSMKLIVVRSCNVKH
jgi:hypothetical protein